MADLDGLRTRFWSISPGIRKLAEEGKRILVVTHIDADGLCSGTIVLSALERMKANVTIRCVQDLDPDTIGGLSSQGFDYHIFTDLASTLVGELESNLNGKYLVIDHHQIGEEDRLRPSVVNAWAYGYDGGREACSSSMAYVFASSLDPLNKDLSPLAVSAPLRTDRMEGRGGRSLVSTVPQWKTPSRQAYWPSPKT